MNLPHLPLIYCDYFGDPRFSVVESGWPADAYTTTNGSGNGNTNGSTAAAFTTAAADVAEDVPARVQAHPAVTTGLASTATAIGPVTAVTVAADPRSAVTAAASTRPISPRTTASSAPTSSSRSRSALRPAPTNVSDDGIDDESDQQSDN
jgi:hypothetical protein